MVDDDEGAAIRRLNLNDIRDVIKAIAVASILLDERLELLEAEMLDLMRQAANKPGRRAMTPHWRSRPRCRNADARRHARDDR
jgi:uncharacterized protein HemY